MKPKKSGPFVVVAVKPKTITIATNGIKDTVSIDRVLKALPKNEHEKPSQRRRTDDVIDTDDIHTQEEYFVDKIAGHSVENGSIIYRIR